MIQLKTQRDGGILKYPELIRTVREEAMLESKKKRNLKPKPVAEVRVISATSDYPEIELLKTQVSQMMEMIAARITPSANENVCNPKQTSNATVVPAEKPI